MSVTVPAAVIKMFRKTCWCGLAHQCGILAVVHPTQGGKVCGLCTVEAMVEARVVAIGKSDHKLSFILSYLFRCKKKQNTKQLHSALILDISY